MGKISDIWVRLGLKSDKFKQGMKDAKKETSSFSSGLNKMKAGALAVWAAVGTAVIKFATDFVGATNKVGDAWARTMSSVKAQYHTLLSELSNTSIDTSGSGSKIGNWFKNEIAWYKRVFGNAKEAGEAAKEMTKSFDAEFELVNSVKLQKAMIQEELNDLYVSMRDTTLSPTDRKAAANRYRELLQPIADAEIAVYSDMLDKAVASWQAGTGLSRQYSTDEMREFFAYYGTDQAGMTAKYGELASVYENKKGDKQNQIIFDILTRLEQANAQMSDVTKVLARTELVIDKSIAELAGAMSKQLAEDLQAGLEDVYDAVDDLEDVEIEIPEIDLSAFDSAEQRIDQFLKNWEADQAQIAQLNGMLESSLVSSMSNGLQAITDMMMGIEGADAKGVLAAFIAPFGDMMKNMGSMIMSYGISMEAFKKAFTNPYVAIAAGAGLMAIGAAISSGAQRISSGSMSVGTGGSYSGGGSYGSSPELQNYESTLTVYVEGIVSGSNILLAGSNQQKKWNR